MIWSNKLNFCISGFINNGKKNETVNLCYFIWIFSSSEAEGVDKKKQHRNNQSQGLRPSKGDLCYTSLVHSVKGLKHIYPSLKTAWQNDLICTYWPSFPIANMKKFYQWLYWFILVWPYCIIVYHIKQSIYPV